MDDKRLAGLPYAIWREYGIRAEMHAAARDLARRGVAVRIGTPLPDLLSAGAVARINGNVAYFAELVRSYRRGLGRQQGQ